MKPWPTSEQARARLKERAGERGESLAALSRLIGRRNGYLGDWIRHGRPEWLDPVDRRRLERYLALGEAEIGWPDEEPAQAPQSGPSGSGYQSLRGGGSRRARG